MPQKYFSIDGVATHLHHTGPTTLPDVVPDLSRGQRVVCLHGAGGNGAVFADLLERLAERHSPIAFDQPAHGRSGGLDSLGSIERMSAFTQALLAKLGVERPVLLGHSMGGAVALQVALERPDGLAGLVLCGSAARLPVPEEIVEQMRRVTEGKERRIFRRDAYSPATPPEILRRGFMEDLKTDPRAGYGDLLACRDWNVEDRLGEVQVPALVITGEDEIEPLRAQADLLAERLPQGRAVAVAKAGHMAPLEQADAVAEAVAGFLEEL